MTRDDLSEFLNQEEDGWDLDNRIHEAVGEIERCFVPRILYEVKAMETRLQIRTYIHDLLVSLVSDASDILARQEREKS